MKWTLSNGGWEMRHILAQSAFGDFAYVTSGREGDLSVSCEKCLRTVSPITFSPEEAREYLLAHLRQKHRWRYLLGRVAPGEYRPLWA